MMQLPLQIGLSKHHISGLAQTVSVPRQSAPPELKLGESVKGIIFGQITLSTADDLSVDVIA